MESSCSIEDIARHTGYAKATVSYALRNHPKIALATRERILAAARELGYRPNPLVKSLMAKIRQGRGGLSDGERLACVTSVPMESSWRFSETQYEILFGARRRAEQQGYVLEEFPLAAAGDGSKLGKVLYHRGIRGVLILPGKDLWRIREFPWENFAAATIGYTLEDPALQRVAVDHFSLIYEGCRALMERGCKRVALICEKNTHHRSNHRLAAGLHAAQAGLEQGNIIPPLILDSFAEDEGRIRAWLMENQPDAVISENQELADDLRRWGYKVPEEIKFVHLFPPSISKEHGTIWANHQEMGAVAIDWITAQLNHNQYGVPEHRHSTLVDGSVIFPQGF